MQKKLIALAVAGLISAPAFAQSNVTIYGVVDAFVGFGDNGKDVDFVGVESGGLSGSRLGFRGTEDLGNGLKGVFVIEQGFNVDNGSGLGGASRQAFVGLNGGFGTVSLGRQYAPGFDYQYDALASAAISPQAILSGGLTITPGSNARWDNSIAYNGAFSGLKVRAIYGMGNDSTAKSAADSKLTYTVPGLEAGKDVSDDDRIGLGVEYGNGPLKVGAVYHLVKSANEDQKEWLVGGSYNFGMATLALSYQDYQDQGGASGVDGSLWQVGAIVPVGAAGNVHIAYGERDDDAADGKASSVTIAYTHAMSKRTTAYAGYNNTDNDPGLAFGPGQFGAGGANLSTDSDLFVVGVRHTF